MNNASSYDGTPNFYVVKGWTPWGDGGRILIHGMTRHLPRENRRLSLERIGPFVPPIFMPLTDELIVTAAVREQLLRAKMGLRFLEVVKARVVEVDWQGEITEYNDLAMGPGESEDIILSRPHSKELADRMPRLFEVIPPRDHVGFYVDTEYGRDPWRIFLMQPSNWSGHDIFRVRVEIVVTDAGRECLTRVGGGQWLNFTQVQLVDELPVEEDEP